MKELEKRLAKLEKKLAESKEIDAKTRRHSFTTQDFVNAIIKMDAKKRAIGSLQRA